MSIPGDWYLILASALFALGAFGLLVLTVRSFDHCLERMPDRPRRSTFIADLKTVVAGGVAIASLALAASGIALAWSMTPTGSWSRIFTR